MGEAILGIVKDAKKVIEDKIRIPVIYLIFIVDLFILLNKKYSDLIDVSNWMPDNIKKLLLTIAKDFNLYSSLAVIILCITLLILSIIMERTSIFSILPKDIDYTDGTTISWNQYSARRRLCNIIIKILTEWWILYITIILLLADIRITFNNNLIIDFWKIQISHNNWNILCLIINVVLVAFYIIRLLFQLKKTTTKRYLDKIEDSYITINSLSIGENSEIKFLKTKYQNEPVFYLVEKLVNDKVKMNKSKENEDTRYIVLDSSKDFEYIKYCFESRRTNMR